MGEMRYSQETSLPVAYIAPVNYINWFSLIATLSPNVYSLLRSLGKDHSVETKFRTPGWTIIATSRMFS